MIGSSGGTRAPTAGWPSWAASLEAPRLCQCHLIFAGTRPPDSGRSLCRQHRLPLGRAEAPFQTWGYLLQARGPNHCAMLTRARLPAPSAQDCQTPRHQGHSHWALGPRTGLSPQPGGRTKGRVSSRRGRHQDPDARGLRCLGNESNAAPALPGEAGEQEMAGCGPGPAARWTGCIRKRGQEGTKRI